ncbi:MAG: PAS domain S-box protein, partial [Desulfovibrionaceae bacterium]
MHTDFFQRERELIHAAEGTLERDDLAPEVRQPFTDLLAGFRRLLNQCRRLLSMGDRMQAQLNELNREIAAKEARYRTIFANAAEGVFRCTDKGEIAEANPALAAIFGFDDPDHLLRETGRLGRLFKQRADRRLYEKLLRETGGVQRFEAAMRRRDGTTLWVQLSTQALGEADGARCGASHVGVVLDVTEHRRMLAELSHMANTDGLTGLCNRRHFMELARRELERSRRT